MEISLKAGEQLLVRCGQDTLSIRCMPLGSTAESELAFDAILRPVADRQIRADGGGFVWAIGHPVIFRSYAPEDFEVNKEGS